MKKFISLLLIVIMTFSFVACTDEDNSSGGGSSDSGSTGIIGTLTTPQNVKVNHDGTVTWDAVANAESYVICISGVDHTVTTTSYKAAVLSDFTFTVKARAGGWNDSAPSAEMSFDVSAYDENILVSISGPESVKSGNSIKLTATVENTDYPTYWFEIEEGEEYATISDDGTFTAKSNSGGNTVTVRAYSDVNPDKYGEKTIAIIAPAPLTQGMIDEIASYDVIGFQGYVDIELWTAGFGSKFEQQSSTPVGTMMDGEKWCATYTNGNTGLEESLYYKKVANSFGTYMANEVGVSYMNTEQYFPMLDNGREVTWAEAGLYNNFASDNLTVSDFAFDEETWMYEYVGNSPSFVDRMIASANPYDFDPVSFYLILDDKGEHINGFYSDSAADYTIASNYVAYQHLTVMYNLGEEEVGVIPSLNAFPTEEWHSPLAEAIENMRDLNANGSYKLDLLNVQGSVYTSGTSLSGFEEIITQNDCLFRNYTAHYGASDDPIKSFDGQDVYGYRDFSEGEDHFYNSYVSRRNASGTIIGYDTGRAFETDFINAKPSFAFAAEIFTYHSVESQDGDGTVLKATYSVNELMTPVGAMLYYGLGNDINMYGLFAQVGYGQGTNFLPFVTVELIDGEYYITSASFYYYLGYLYGIMLIEYSDFNTAAIPDEFSSIEVTKKAAPASWSELIIYDSDDDQSTSDDIPVPADEFFNTYFNDSSFASNVPFFGDAIGDTYGFGLKYSYLPAGQNIMKQAVALYYDVPLDMDYTINSSIQAVEKLLVENGFKSIGGGNYQKGNVCVAPVDSSLDFLIYVWKA